MVNEKIFISYSRTDKDLVYHFVEEIEKRVGTKCWIDLNGIESSDHFIEKIISAINAAEIVLFMYSKASSVAPYVRKEVQFAFNKKKRVILVLMDNTPLDDYFLFQFGTLDYIDYFKEEQKNKLFANIKGWLNIPQQQTAVDNVDYSKKYQENKLFTNITRWFNGSQQQTTKSQDSVLHAPTKHSFEEKSSKKSYKLGDIIVINGVKGIIYELDESGCHGKAVSIAESTLVWCVKNDLGFETNAHDSYDGSNNMDIIKRNVLWEKRFPAFSWCSELGRDWYLPSIKEVEDFIQCGLKNDSYNIERYWSSTEWDANNATFYYVYGGYPYNGSKAKNRYVRAVAKF